MLPCHSSLATSPTYLPFSSIRLHLSCYLTPTLYRLVCYPYHITATTTFTKNNITTPQSLPHNPDASRLPDFHPYQRVITPHYHPHPYLPVRHFTSLPHSHPRFVTLSSLVSLPHPYHIILHYERLICCCTFFSDWDNVP